VVDRQGKAVLDAKVSATDRAKGTAAHAVIDAEGRLAFPNLLPSTYDIDIEGAGFKKYEERDQAPTARYNGRVDANIR
jgi:hypothetical protein